MVRTKRAKAVSLRLTLFSTLRLCANQDKSFTQSRKEKKTVRRKEESPVFVQLFPTNASRIRSAVLPSQSGGIRRLDLLGGLSNARTAASTIFVVSVPAI